jgi:hypothetical protein
MVWMAGQFVVDACDIWQRYYGALSANPYPAYRYERYSPSGKLYPWSAAHYYPPPAGHGGVPGQLPVPRYRYERYSPAGFPYPESRVDYYSWRY